MSHELVGRSPQIERVRRMIEKASGTRVPVLLLGETGTGKEVIARALHQSNPRGQFVPIDCGSLVGTLMESELFGHTKGSFSGAGENKKGLVELADGGTAFFDEIGDLPLEMQVKLLRVIQEREFRAVGSLQWKQVDLRIIAATHRDLKQEVAAGRFRQDLYYRLNVFTIRVPPLREREGDVALLIDHFLEAARHPGLPALSLGERILRTLHSYCWPGNVRELKNCIDRMALMQSDGEVQLADLPTEVAAHHYGSRGGLQRVSPVTILDEEMPPASLAPISPVISPPREVIPFPSLERQAIQDALEVTHGEKARAAKLLKTSRTTLYRKMREYGLAAK